MHEMTNLEQLLTEENKVLWRRVPKMFAFGIFLGLLIGYGVGVLYTEFLYTESQCVNNGGAR